MTGKWPLVAALVSVAAMSATAQTVHGAVVDAANGPVAGVVVVLLDAQSRETTRALTNDRGEFRLTVSAPGSYRLRAIRIGYRPTVSEPFALDRAAEVERRLQLAQIAFSLDTVVARDRNSCRVVATDSTSTMFAVWEQVRGALTATRLSLGGRNMLATTMGYTQMLDLAHGRVAEQTADIRTEFLQQPWRSLTPDSLRKSGYVITEAGDIRTYNAPGIDVLLSDAFLQDHCLRLAMGSDAQRLGIAFEPTPERSKIAEIRGTLWLDRRTAELRRLEYRYVNVSRDEERSAGGEMSFIRMQNGNWVIAKWNIRMPTIMLVPVYKGVTIVSQEQRVDSIKVEGGEIVSVVSAIGGRRDTVWTRPTVVLSGIVLDSLSGRPVPGTVVALPATKQTSAADATGRFEIRGLLPGRYQLEVRTPSLDSLRMAHVVPVLFTDSSQAVQLRVPSGTQILNSVCPGSDLTPRSRRTGVLVGAVMVSGDSAPRPGIRVVARWNIVNMLGKTIDNPPKGDEGWHITLPNIYGEPRITDVRTDSTGVFRLCDIPTGVDLNLQAIIDTSTQGFRRIRIPDAQRMARIDFTIDPARSTAASFTGTVEDSSRSPLADAEILIPEFGISARADARGVFRIPVVIPGAHLVIVRKAGYGALEATVEFAPSQALDRRIVLSRSAQMLDSVLTLESTLYREAPLLREFEVNRKIGLGKFFARAELEKVSGRSMVSLFEFPGFRTLTLNGGQWIKSSRTTSINPECFELEDATGPVPRGANCGCFPILFLDGQKLSDQHRVANINRFKADDLEAVEFYRSGAETPQRYSVLNSQCGVIVLHSRRTK